MTRKEKITNLLNKNETFFAYAEIKGETISAVYSVI
jgi:hypothetical protein